MTRWTCSDCGKDLGPAALKYRMDKHFPYPAAYRGADNRTLCGGCWDKESANLADWRVVVDTVKAAQGVTA